MEPFSHGSLILLPSSFVSANYLQGSCSQTLQEFENLGKCKCVLERNKDNDVITIIGAGGGGQKVF